MRSSPENAACPSFMWQTVGILPSARRARMPPMPSTISCWMRMSLVAAVELGGDAAVLGRVLRDVGVEQVERHAADLDAPDAERQTSRPGSGTLTSERLAVGVQSRG